jgi:hypothetical protein
MTCIADDNPGALFSYESIRAAGQLNDVSATVDFPLAADTLLPSSKGRPICTDYSEEAIPERDPAYHPSDATLYETQTFAHNSTTERLALARCLEKLGMSRARATVVASL